MTATIPWLKSAPCRIAVVGDIILDEYLEGQVTRISPEAPVPIHWVQETRHVAGGAANAARNVQKLGAIALPFAVLAKDSAGEKLAELLRLDGIATEHLLWVGDRPTIRKTRVTANHQQLLRLDWEKVIPLAAEQEIQLIDAFRRASFDAVLISDYGKGLLTESLLWAVIAVANERQKPVVVDPKSKDFTRYVGCTLITPNRKEATTALGAEEIADKDIGGALIKRYGLKDVLVTLGPKGMMYHRSKSPNQPVVRPSEAREVYDVSGAGDAVAATMALALASDATPEVGVELATLAAGIVVGKWGTQAASLGELLQAMNERRGVTHPSQKRVTADTLVKALGPKRERSRKVVFTNGCFDILHAGHVSYLEEARKLGDLLVIGINADESIRRLKGESRPINRLEDRIKVLASLGCVDYVVPFAEDTPLSLIETLVPDVLVKGADWQVDKIVGRDVVEAAGGKVATIQLVEGLSTTELAKRITKL